MFALDHVLRVGSAEGKDGKGRFRTFFGKKKLRHIAVGVKAGLFAKAAHELRLIDENYPSVITHLKEKVAHEGKIIAAVPGFGKVRVVFDRLVEKESVNW